MGPVVQSLLLGSGGGPFGGVAAAIATRALLRRGGAPVRAKALAFAAGFILCSAFLEMVGRGVMAGREWWSVALVLVGLLAGVALHAGVVRLTEGEAADSRPSRGHDHELEHAYGKGENAGGARGAESGAAGGGEADQALSEARDLAVSIAIVNVIEGLPVGVGFAVGQRLGLLIGGLMIFENFTEGLLIGSVVARTKSSFGRLFFLTTAPAVTLGFGAALGAFLGGISPVMLRALFGLGAGIMIHVVTGEILEDMLKLNGGKPPIVWITIGIVLGAAFAAIG